MSVSPSPQPEAGRDKQPVSLRLSSTARAILAHLSAEQGISRAGLNCSCAAPAATTARTLPCENAIERGSR